MLSVGPQHALDALALVASRVVLVRSLLSQFSNHMRRTSNMVVALLNKMHSVWVPLDSKSFLVFDKHDTSASYVCKSHQENTSRNIPFQPSP